MSSRSHPRVLEQQIVALEAAAQTLLMQLDEHLLETSSDTPGKAWATLADAHIFLTEATANLASASVRLRCGAGSSCAEAAGRADEQARV